MYGEIIVGVNMLFNYAILSFANKVGNVHAARGRLLFASFTGALPVYFSPHRSLRSSSSFLGMTLYAFGRHLNRGKSLHQWYWSGLYLPVDY